MSTAGTIKRRTLITGTNNPAYQVSKDAYNDALVVASAAPDGAPMIRDSAQADGWGFFTAGALGDLLYVGASDALTTLTAAAGIPYWSAPGVAPTVLTIGGGLSIVGSALTAPAGSVAGTDTQVIFNDAGVYAGDAGLMFDKVTNTLTAGALTLTAPLQLASGGLGVALSDPGADRIPFWDDSAGAVAWLTAGSGLSIAGTTLTASAAITGTDTHVLFFDGANTPAGDSGLTYNKTTDNLSVAGGISNLSTSIAWASFVNGTKIDFGAGTTISIGSGYVFGLTHTVDPSATFLLTHGSAGRVNVKADGGAFGSLAVGTVYGSDAANGDLAIHGTSHATKTTSDVAIQPGGGTISTGGVACVASFGPAAVASITVKNGLITAIS